MKLTAKQQKFIIEYLIDLNATQAAIRAGYSEKTAAVIGMENLTKPYIRAEIEQSQKNIATKAGVTVERIIEELAKIGFSSIDDYVSFGNNSVILKDSATIPKEKIAAIAEVSKTVSEGGATLKFKLHDKISALDKLARHLGMYKDSPSSDKPVSVAVQVNIIHTNKNEPESS